MHFCTIVAAIVIGSFGGVLGALFVRFNVVINNRRKRMLSRIAVLTVRKVVLILEMLLIVVSRDPQTNTHTHTHTRTHAHTHATCT